MCYYLNIGKLEERREGKGRKRKGGIGKGGERKGEFLGSIYLRMEVLRSFIFFGRFFF